MRLARQTFYFIFIHAAPFYSFFALRCWRRDVRGRNSSGRSARSCSRCRQRSQRQKSHTHTSSSAEPDTPLETGLGELAQQPLSLHTSPLTAYPSLPAPLSIRSANVVVCGLALALLCFCFFSRLFFRLCICHSFACLSAIASKGLSLAQSSSASVSSCASFSTCFLLFLAAHDGNGNNDSANETTLLPGKQIFSCIFNFAKYLLPKKSVETTRCAKQQQKYPVNGV